jgi:hypothetical protein
MDQLKHLIDVWTGYGQGLAGSIGALAFVFAFIWMRRHDRGHAEAARNIISSGLVCSSHAGPATR